MVMVICIFLFGFSVIGEVVENLGSPFVFGSDPSPEYN